MTTIPLESADPSRIDLATLRATAADESRRTEVLDRLQDELTGFDRLDPPNPEAPLPLTGFDADIRDEGLDWPATALTMVGRRRLSNFRSLIEQAVREGIPGDIVETGVWRGGAAIFARAVLATMDVADRRVIVADSFQGLPAPDTERWPQDERSNLHTFDMLAVSLDQVRANFERYDLLDDQVVFLPGWFKDTMPLVPSEQVAVLRLDGDMYESTRDPLLHLYDRIPPGGWVIIDDYIHEACKQAVHDFLGERGEQPEIIAIDRVGSYFRKPA